jgi:PAS domain S-box-containing protein
MRLGASMGTQSRPGPRQWLWASLGLLTGTLVFSAYLYTQESQREAVRLTQLAQHAAASLQAELEDKKRALAFTSFLFQTSQAANFHAFFGKVQGRSALAEVFWVEHAPAKRAGQIRTDLIREQTGPKFPSLEIGLDLAPLPWAREAMDAAFVSNSVSVVRPPASPGIEPRLLLVAPVSNEVPARFPGQLANDQLRGFLIASVPWKSLLPSAHQPLQWRIETAPGSSDAGQTIYQTTAAASEQLTWLDHPVPLTGKWQVRVGTSHDVMLERHDASTLALVLGLLLTVTVAVWLRGQQRRLHALRTDLAASQARLQAQHELELKNFEARGLGTFVLNEHGAVLRANQAYWSLLKQASQPPGQWHLSQWWLGLGSDRVPAALAELAEQTTRQGNVHTMVRRADGSSLDVGLSLQQQTEHGQTCWAGVIENLDLDRQTAHKQALLFGGFEQTADLLSLWDADLHCLLANPAFSRWTNRPQQAMLGQDVSNLLSSALEPSCRLALEGATQKLDLSLTSPKDGSHRTFAITIQRIHLDGEAAVLRIQASDVSAERVAQEAQASAERQLKLLYDFSPLGVFMARDGTGVLKANGAFQKLLGRSEQELRDTRWNLIAPSVGSGSDARALAQLRESGRLQRYERDYQHKDGHAIPTAVYGMRLPDNGERGVYWFIVEDLSVVQAQAAKIKANNTILQTAIEALGQAFVIYDDQDRLYYCNQRYREIYNTSAPLLREGMKFEDILRYGVMHGQYPQALGREEEWLQERMAAHHKQHHVLDQATDDGRWLRIVECQTPERFTVGFRMDVTEEIEARQAAESANQAKSQFLASMSHEIRTPLNGILGMAQILQFPDLTDDKRVEYAQTIAESGNVLLHLLNQILDLSKIEAGKVELALSPTNPAALCQQVVQLFASNAELKSLSLSSDWQGPTMPYLLDAQRLTQMLSDLVGNAVKFTQTGGVRIEAHEIRREGKYATLEFSVLDTGPGISQADQSSLFKPFSQLDASNSSHDGSSGLGLSIVKSMAELMGGQAGVDSTVGEGSRFYFQISVEAAGSATTHEARADHSDQPVTDISECARGVRVMVLEDNPVMQRLLRVMLENLGAEVVCFDDGQPAMDALTVGDTAQVLLLDLNMPRIGGLAVAEMVRQMEADLQQAPRILVAVTASTHEEDRQRCLAVGMDGVLTKPVAVEQLADVFIKWRDQLQTADKVARAVPIEAVERLWGKLEPQLINHQYYAIPSFDALYAELAGTGHDEALQQALLEVHNYNFDAALVRLRQLLEPLLNRP